MPKITDGKEVRLTIDRNRHTLLVRELTPKTAADFVVSAAAGTQDQGLISTNSSAGVSINAFYTGVPRLRAFPASTNLYIRNSRDRRVAVVQLED